MYTSLELSKKLKENGCKLESHIGWYVYFDKDLRKPKLSEIGNMNRESICLAYDLMHDICIKYRHKFFNNSDVDFLILRQLQQGNIKKAELIIWQQCKFNPKNKIEGVLR